MRITLDRALRDRLDKSVPWGLRSALMQSTVEMLVSAVERRGPIVLGAIIAGKMRIEYDDKD